MSSRAWGAQKEQTLHGCRDNPVNACPAPSHLPQVYSIPAHREGSVVQGPGNPHSGLSRRTFSAAAASHALLPPVPSVSAHGPASSLEHRQYP